MPSFEEYCEEIKDIWNSHWLTNMGVKHKELQKELENYLGILHVALYTNGHLALENAIAALNLPKGGEVITTPFTFASWMCWKRASKSFSRKKYRVILRKRSI